MKFKIFTRTDMKATRSDEPFLSIAPKNYVRLNRHLANQLNVEQGDQLAIAQDEEKPKDWFLIKDHPDGFVLKQKDSANGFNIQCASLVKLMRDSLGLKPEDKGQRFKVATRPVSDDQPKVFAILTAKPL